VAISASDRESPVWLARDGPQTHALLWNVELLGCNPENYVLSITYRISLFDSHRPMNRGLSPQGKQLFLQDWGTIGLTNWRDRKQSAQI
jgi:hypothetical protein